MAYVKPKKALGQHFLTDASIAERIASTLDEYPNLPVVEIGPGTGMLTQLLIPRHQDLTVVEIDRESVDWLQTHFPALDGHIVSGDFLRMDPAQLFDGNEQRAAQFCVIGNYPYNISSQIFFKVYDWRNSVVCCSGMLQREVAERLAARPGTKARGILSVLLQAFYTVDYLFTVDENVFNPPPKVKSGVIKMVRRPEVTSLPCDEALFKTVVKTTFGQRRKTLRNSVRGLVPAGTVLPDNDLMGLRPEQLSVEQFIDLTNMVAAMRAAAPGDKA